MSQINLDDVHLTPAAVVRWQKFAKRLANSLKNFGVTQESDIPDEAVRVNADGTLTIFVTLPKGEVKMIVPVADWSYRTKH